MSTSKGSQCRKRAQKHQNRTAFRNDLHDTSRKTKILNSLEVSGVCNRCKDIIEWKIKYKKYKPLTAPAKCVACNEKTVKHAYHVMCSKCAGERKVCAKCAKQPDKGEEETQSKNETHQNADIQAMLKTLSERKRRTVLRHLKKHGESDSKMTPEMKSNIEELLSRINDCSLDNDEDFDSSNEELTENDEEN